MPQRSNQFPALQAFYYPRFRRIWIASVFTGLGTGIERLVIGWFVLEQTDSILLTALSFALRNAPNLFLGPIGGATADSVPRIPLLLTTLFCKAILLSFIGLLLLSNIQLVWSVFVLVLLIGIIFTFEVPAIQALITDVVPSEVAMNSIALYSVGTRAIGVIGAIVGGVAIEQIGIGAAFLIAAVMIGLGMSFIAGVTTQPIRKRSNLKAVFATAMGGIHSMLGLPLVRLLLILTIVMEILAYSYQSLLPSIARNVLYVGPTGLGTLSFAAGIGSLVGSTTLSLLGNFRYRGLLLLGVIIGYGTFLITFAISSLFPISVVLIMGIGAMASLFDALQWIMLQQYVPPEMRGRVIGGWVFATGFGWLGHLVLGATAEWLGVQQALVVSGTIVAALGISLFCYSARLRRA